ncbi:MAG: hypothetical protein ACRDQZ_13205 [Mycobacteriales bacterium]
MADRDYHELSNVARKRQVTLPEGARELPQPKGLELNEIDASGIPVTEGQRDPRAAGWIKPTEVYVVTSLDGRIHFGFDLLSSDLDSTPMSLRPALRDSIVAQVTAGLSKQLSIPPGV